MPLCTATFVLGTEADSYTTLTRSGVTQSGRNMKFLVFPWYISLCAFGVALLSSTILFVQYNTSPMWTSLLSPIICKRSSSGKLVYLQWFFAYLRIPDDYLDSSVLLASETWDSCPWNWKNTQNLKTTVNLDLSLLSSYWWKATAIQVAALVYKGGTILKLSSSR